MNNFDEVSNDGHQMSLAGKPGGKGGHCTVRSHV